MGDKSYIAEYADGVEPKDIHRLLRDVPGVEIEEFLFPNSTLDLRYVVLEADESTIDQLRERDEFAGIEVEGTGTAYISPQTPNP